MLRGSNADDKYLNIGGQHNWILLFRSYPIDLGQKLNILHGLEECGVFYRPRFV